MKRKRKGKGDPGYYRFFQEELYPKFISFLLGRMSARDLCNLTGGTDVFTRSGVHFRLRKHFSAFLERNPKIHKKHRDAGYKCMVVRNCCGEPIHTPIDCSDDGLMVKEGIRVPEFVPGKDRGGRVWLATGYR